MFLVFSQMTSKSTIKKPKILDLAPFEEDFFNLSFVENARHEVRLSVKGKLYSMEGFPFTLNPRHGGTIIYPYFDASTGFFLPLVRFPYAYAVHNECRILLRVHKLPGGDTYPAPYQACQLRLEFCLPGQIYHDEFR
jgi:hypothetical protein